MVNDSDCVFCRIIRGELDSAAVYEDESTLAFLDLRQSNEGHVLVVPRNHIEQIYDLDEDTASSLASTVGRIARAIRRVYAPEGLSIWQSNGPAAFQECRMFTGMCSRDIQTMAISSSIPVILPVVHVKNTRCSRLSVFRFH